MASFRPDSSEPLQRQQHTQHHQQHQHEMIDIQGSQRQSSAGKNKMVVTTLDGEEEEIEVIGSGIGSSFQPASDKGQRLPSKLPNLKYDAPESSVNNYSPGTSVIFNAYRGHGRLLTQPYAISSDNESDRPPEHTYQRLPGSQSQEWSQDPYRQHPHSQSLSPSHPYDSDGYPSYHQQHYPNYPSYHTPHDRPYHPYSSNNQDPRDPLDSRDTRDPPIDPRDYRDFRDREPYGREFDSTHSRPGPPSPRIGSSGKPDDQEGRGRMGHYPPPHPRDSRVAQPPPMPHRLRSPHNALDPPHPKNPHSPYDDPVSSRYHPFPSQQRSPADPWESSSEHRPPYPSTAINIPQPPHRRSINTPSSYRRHEPLDNTRSQHHNSYPHIPHQSPSSSSAGPSNYRDPFNPPRGEGPRYEFSRINYQMIFEYANEIRDCLIKGKVGTTDRLLYNAEILSKIFMGCRVDQEPIDHVEGEVALNPHQLRCTSCNIVKTPEWRKGPLGPRTLCNACGLIWGKLSRSKAALAAKSKQESGTKAAESEMPAMDSQTTAATTAGGVEIPKRPATDPITLTDIARKKRGHGRSTTRDDGEDTGSGTMMNDNEAPGSAGQNGSSSLFPHINGQSGSQGQAEDVIMSGGVSPPPPQPSFRPSNGEPHTVKEGGYQIDPFLAAAGPAPLPQSPDTLPFSTHENHDKEGPVAGRKLNLSYLLA